MQENRPRWSQPTRIVISLLVLALTVFLLYKFRVILPPLILAVILAYIVTPLTNSFQKRLKLRRGFAAIIAFVTFYLVLAVVPAVFVPLLVSQFNALNVDFQNIENQVQSLIAHQYAAGGYVIDGEAITRQVLLSLNGLLEPLFANSLGIVVDVISSIVWVVFIAVVSFYLVKDGPALWRWIEHLVPPPYYNDFVILREKINSIWSAFFRGQITLAVVVMLIFAVVGFILGLPFWLAMAVFAGLMEFLPSIGHGIWLVTASVLSLFLGSTWIPLPPWIFMLIVIGLHLFFEQFDLNYLIPRIIGHSVHLPPLVVILGIVAGAVLAGVMGIPLAAPVIASARVLGWYIYANLFDLDPFAEEPTRPLPPPNLTWWRSHASRRLAAKGE
jgi:predicted PurR-regulated permease PerM